MNTAAVRTTTRRRGTVQDVAVRVGNVINRFMGLPQNLANRIRGLAQRTRRSMLTGRRRRVQTARP